MDDLINIFESGRKIAEAYLAKIKLCELTLTNTTLAYIGGYNARPFSLRLNIFEAPRTTSIKGLWKWWLRAYIAGATIFKTKQEPDWKDVISYANYLLGSTKEASKIRITLRPEGIRIKKIWKLDVSQLHNLSELDEANIVEATFEGMQEKDQKRLNLKLKNLKEIPRIRLLTMKRPREDLKNTLTEIIYLYPPGGFEINIGIYERYPKILNDNEKMLLLGSLITALIFNGIGAITKRGFGNVRIDLRYCIFPKLKEIVDKIYSSNSAINLRNNIISLIKLTLRAAKEAVNISVKAPLNLCPEHPSIILDNEFFSIDVIDHSIPQEYHLKPLIAIGSATLKTSWKKIFFESQRLKRIEYLRKPGGQFHTWVLGLPRGQKIMIKTDGKKRFDAGYYINYEKKNKGRRPSPIGACIILSNGKYWIVTYKFCSLDWPEKIIHVGIHKTRETHKPIPQPVHRIPLTDPTRRRPTYNKATNLRDLIPVALNVAYDTFREIIRRRL